MIYMNYIDKYTHDVMVSGIEMFKLQHNCDLHSILVLNMIQMWWSCNDELFNSISEIDG